MNVDEDLNSSLMVVLLVFRFQVYFCPGLPSQLIM